MPNLPSVEKAVDTRKELAEAVGLGERTMGKVIQIDENAPDAIKEALDKKELSINKGYDLTRQLQDVPEDQREQAAAELLEYEKAKKELKQQESEIDRRGKVANLFCKAYRKGCPPDGHRRKRPLLDGRHPHDAGRTARHREGVP
ncbi:MAG: hypothetical protein V8S81_00145 [Oscillospiraceae bacterium]